MFAVVAGFAKLSAFSRPVRGPAQQTLSKTALHSQWKNTLPELGQLQKKRALIPCTGTAPSARDLALGHGPPPSAQGLVPESAQ